MAQRLKQSGSGSTSVPRGAVLVCNRITEIQAQKGSMSNWPYEYFRHKFTKAHGQVYECISVPKGKLIYDKVEQVKGIGYKKVFKNGKVYGLKDGRISIVSGKCKLIVVAPYPLWDIFSYPE